MYVTYGNGLATGALRSGRVHPAPALLREELLDVPSSRVDDAKSGNVDRSVLYHLTFPTVVHYLIT